MFEIKTSEFDFQPQQVRVLGSAVPQKIDVNTLYAVEEEQVGAEMDPSLTSSVIKRKGRTLLTDKSTRPKKTGHVTLDKLPEKSFKGGSTAGKGLTSDEEALLKMRAAHNMSDDEFAFLKDYRRLEELEREKGIKFFQCIGDPPATEEFVANIQVKRLNFIEEKELEMREQDCLRFATEVNSDKVVVPTNVNIT